MSDLFTAVSRIGMGVKLCVIVIVLMVALIISVDGNCRLVESAQRSSISTKALAVTPTPIALQEVPVIPEQPSVSVSPDIESEDGQPVIQPEQNVEAEPAPDTIADQREVN